VARRSAKVGPTLAAKVFHDSERILFFRTRIVARRFVSLLGVALIGALPRLMGILPQDWNNQLELKSL
jgi:hypothetical protein